MKDNKTIAILGTLGAVVFATGFAALVAELPSHHHAAPTTVTASESAAQTASRVETQISAHLPGGTWSERGADVTGAYAVESYLNADSVPPVVVSQYRDPAVAEQAVTYYQSLGEYSPVVADGSIVILVSNTATPAEAAAVQAVLPAGAAQNH